MPSIANPQHNEDGAADTTSFTLPSFAVPGGDDKILIVGAHAENNPQRTIDSATHNAVGLTKRLNYEHSINAIACFDLLLGSTTPSGDVVVTASDAVSGWLVGAVVLVGAKQQAPEGTAVTGHVTSSPINQNKTTLSAGAMLIDVYGGSHNTVPAITQGPDQVQDIAVAVSGSFASFGMSHRVGGAAGSHTLGWSDSGAARLLQGILSYAAAVGGSGVRVAAAAIAGL